MHQTFIFCHKRAILRIIFDTSILLKTKEDGDYTTNLHLLNYVFLKYSIL